MSRRLFFCSMMIWLFISGPSLVQAAEPPACVPVVVSQVESLRQLKAWSGWHPVSRWRRTAVHLDRCETARGEGRLTLEVTRSFKGSSALFALTLQLALNPKRGQILRSKRQAAQLRETVKTFEALARAAMSDTFVRAWMRHQSRDGVLAPILMDDQGGYGPACLEFESAPRIVREKIARLRWCAAGEGIALWSVRHLSTFRQRRASALLALSARAHPKCEVAWSQVRRRNKRARATLNYKKSEHCSVMILRSRQDPLGRWKVLKTR